MSIDGQAEKRYYNLAVIKVNILYSPFLYSSSNIPIGAVQLRASFLYVFLCYRDFPLLYLPNQLNDVLIYARHIRLAPTLARKTSKYVPWF